MSIQVYTKPACVQCNATHQALDKAGVSYEVIDVSVDQDARAKIVDMGYLQVPVVVVDEHTHWSGFRPDRLKSLAA